MNIICALLSHFKFIFSEPFVRNKKNFNSIKSQKYFKKVIFFNIVLLLSGCAVIAQPIKEKAAATIAQDIDSAATGVSYPVAGAVNPDLENNPPHVDLSQYQSVQSIIGRPRQRPDIAIAVAASGGGYRAANLTAGVLMGLEQTTDPHLKGNLLEEVDYFSTVSGGGLGVGYYLASLYNYLQEYGNSPFNPEFSFSNTIQSLPVINPLDQDYSKEIFSSQNGGEKIEDKINDAILKTNNAGTLLLGNIFIPRSGSPAAVKLPYWVTNATIYQNAALFPFTPDVLQKYAVRSYSYHEATHAINNGGYDVPAAVGMTASASYPFAVPPVTLTSVGCQENPCYLHLLDGGLADNLGVYTALNLLSQDTSKIKILIVIDAYKAALEPYSKQLLPPSNSTIFWRILTMSADAERQNIKQNVNVLAKDMLCRQNATNVLVIYLDLAKYPQARNVSTSFTITPAQQKILLQAGEDLVLKNKQFALLKQFLAGDKSIGQCEH